MNPKISVILPVYNGGKYLKEAIDSILKQTFINYEFIIIDDGSTDDSSDLINLYSDERIKFIKQNNNGLAYSLNIGIKKSSGRYIARMDQDDISHPERFKKQIDFMENHNEYVAIGTWANYISKEGKFLYTSKTPYIDADLRQGLPYVCPFVHSSVMIRTDALKEVGGYKDGGRYFYQEDILLWIDLSRIGKLYNLPEALQTYRILPNSASKMSIANQSYQQKIYIEYYNTGHLNFKMISAIESKWCKDSIKKTYSCYYLIIGKIFIEKNFNRLLSFNNLVKSLRYDFLKLKAYYHIFLLLLPRKIIYLIKNIEST